MYNKELLLGLTHHVISMMNSPWKEKSTATKDDDTVTFFKIEIDEIKHCLYSLEEYIEKCNEQTVKKQETKDSTHEILYPKQ